MPDAVTPAADAPVAPAPVAAAAAPAAEVKKDEVVLPKEEYDQLKRDAARAAGAQRKADLFDRTHGKSGGHFAQPVAPAAAPSVEERQAAAAEEDRKAERGLMALAVDPEYRDILDKDHTLRDLLVKNPLALLPSMAPEAIDAEDAVALVKEQLAKRKPAPAAAAVVTPPAAVAPVVAPPAGGVNVKSTGTDEEYETARKLPNTESAVAAMIRSRAAKMGK